ncbi:sugar phosphate isomerase/epimerase [Palleronia sp. LCG004]|uniref:sugar phosphate isomerase/epimerase family protein n=1 Tax=Palleronia sp. LCG004 TaxID=3079304 RepID=UPI00294244A2|nr:sugar phosphate isomerase/epimerase [Palleronia sp. LCG004]WOI58135.1 sugar phosphate isomerase/epimerase [Palleronia sp. LCG004]
MADRTFRFGCQTFTWEMLGDGWTGGPDDLVEAIAAAGYEGIEITDTMIGHYADRPADFARRLDEAGLALAAFAFGSKGGFSEPSLVDDDLEACRRWCAFAAHFPGAVASMGSATAMSPGARDDKLKVAADIYARATEIGRAEGVDVAVHPSSHHDTLLYDRSDYDRLFDIMDASVGWVPDTGHILRGGQDPVEAMIRHRARIRYVHLKDVTRQGDWAMMGEGVCDTRAILETAAGAPRFNGWVVVEEESETAGRDPADAIHRNRETLRAIDFG